MLQFMGLQRLEEAQTGIKIAGRNISNLRYADDTTLMAERQQEQPLDESERVKSGKAGLKLNSENEDHGIWSHLSRQTDGETRETLKDFILGGPKITVDGDCRHETKRCLLLGRKAMTNLAY